MSRYTGPTTRINRRFGMAVFPANKAFERRTYPPGSMDRLFEEKLVISVRACLKSRNLE